MLPPPADEGQHEPTRKKRPENDLVVPCEPAGKIDVEVVASLHGETCRDVGQRTTPAVEQEHEYFDEDDADEEEGPANLAAPREYRNGEDASGEDGPDDSVHELHKAKRD